ncbi:hypothetical protein GWJ21_13820 [Bacillus coagulans]|uniref:restriction endonuclease subunit S n=1 Tax=Heyndrickxia coagulans TaxID=1398 RepID=UPI00137721B4|nr:restriction endonuclease subunit S [Heyndrickxia coagulans]NCG68966.1 hypothetical protein [Heyndrickxia coagulans]
MSVGKILSRNENKIGKITFPNDWSIYKLSDILKLVKRPIKMEDQKFYNLVTIKRRFGGMVKRERLRGNQIQVKSQFSVKSGDFVISKRQISHGACAIVPEKLDGSIVSNEYNILRNKENLDLEFFNWYVQLPFMQRYFYLSSDGVHIEKLLFKLEDWLQRKVCIPEVKEQKKIAKIISTWDKAIELKEKLIEQKKKQKKGLMQKLLTGEVRLPGYSGEWKKVKLGEILKERKETGYTELELLAITSSKGVVKRTEVDIKDNSSEDKSKYKRILPNDIGYNTMRMWQGVSGVSKYEGIVSPAYTILKPTNKVNSNFIGYLFKLPKIINLFRRYSQGLVSDTLNLKYENLKGIKVTIPQDVEEQKKIAEILLSIDNEIEMLQEYVNYLKQQKKGLMQLLLTGKVRVKV